MYKFFLWMAKNDSFRVVTMCVFHTFICEPLPAAAATLTFSFSSFPKLPFNAFAVRMCESVQPTSNCLTLASFSLILRYNCAFNYFLFHPFIKQRTFCLLEFRVVATKRIAREKQQTHSQLRDCGKQTYTYIVQSFPFSISIFYYCW